MKKLNMNEPGTVLMKISLIFLIPIPILLWIIDRIFSARDFSFGIYLSLTIGLSILVILGILVGIELKQDRRLNNIYLQNRNRKLQISGSGYECQSCGNRQVHLDDKFCSICGINFKN